MFLEPSICVRGVFRGYHLRLFHIAFIYVFRVYRYYPHQVIGTYRLERARYYRVIIAQSVVVWHIHYNVVSFRGSVALRLGDQHIPERVS